MLSLDSFSNLSTLMVAAISAEGLPLDMVQRFSGSRHKARGKPEVAGREEGDGDNSQRLSVKITLSFKRYMFDAKKRMAQ